jgi:hypothetical protein
LKNTKIAEKNREAKTDAVTTVFPFLGEAACRREILFSRKNDSSGSDFC